MDNRYSIEKEKLSQSIEFEKGLAAHFSASADEKQRLYELAQAEHAEAEKYKHLYEEEKAKNALLEEQLNKLLNQPQDKENYCAEDIEFEEIRQGFPLITDQCRKENKMAEVDAQLKAACQGTAIELWRVIRLNEALGYMSVRHLNTRTVYNAIQDYFGPLPYTERNFRDARNKK